MNLYEFEIERTFYGYGTYTKAHKYQIPAETEYMAYFRLGQNYPDLKGEFDFKILSCKVVGELK